MNFPTRYWTKVCTNNVIERINREIERRTKVVGAFQNWQSALMLVCDRLRHIAGSSWGFKCYTNMKRLYEAKELELSFSDAV